MRFIVECEGSRISVGSRFESSEFRIQGLRFGVWVEGSGFIVEYEEFRN